MSNPIVKEKLIQLDEKTLLSFVSDYFISIGCDPAEVNGLFSSRFFDDALVLKLPMVCILRENRPKTSKTNQSHIHVTGTGRELFYSKTALDSITQSTEWEKQLLVLSLENINSLLKFELKGHLHESDSFVMKKISYRAREQCQVELSRKSEPGDDSQFISLRKGLYEDDILVFLKYKNIDKLFVVGIPASFYKNKYEYKPKKKSENGSSKGIRFTSLKNKKAIPINKVLESLISGEDAGIMLDQDDTVEDAIYQDLVDSARSSSTTIEPVLYDAAKDGKKTADHRPATNPSLGKEAIKDNQYHCLIDASHETFVKPDGTNYMEAHHLIPMSKQDAFKYKLDTKANICPVCPMCHRKLHYGCFSEIEPMLKILYSMQKDKLKQSGIEIDSFDKLKEFYHT